jgi:hypothetical protein
VRASTPLEEIERNAEAKSKVYGELVRIGNISLE